MIAPWRDRRGHRRSSGQHGRTGERVDVTDGVHRAVVEAEQGRLRAVVEQHPDTTARNEVLVFASGGPHLNVVEKCHDSSLVNAVLKNGLAECQWAQGLCAQPAR